MTDRTQRKARDFSAFDANVAVDALLQHLQVPAWDILLVGDGSGSTWEGACGWSCVLVDRQTRGRKLFFGGMNVGSNYLAEAMPYLHALLWYHQASGKGRIHKFGLQRVAIVTDSASFTNGLISTNPEALPMFWGAWNEMKRMGYVIEPRWLRRSTISMNVLVDMIAGKSRSVMLGASDLVEADRAAFIRNQFAQIEVAGPDGITPADLAAYNPDAAASNPNPA